MSDSVSLLSYNSKLKLYPWVAERAAKAGIAGCEGAARGVKRYKTELNLDGTHTGIVPCADEVPTSLIP